MLYVMPFLLAMVVTMAWLPVFGRVATKWGIVDRPGDRKVHAIAVPRVGGLAMVLGVLVAAFIVIPLDSNDRYFLLAAVVLAAFGVADDRFDLDYRIKLAGQLIAVFIVTLGGDIQIHSITLDERLFLPPWLSIPLTVMFLVGITNAINLADGLDGLAGGTTFLCLGALALLAHSSGQAVGAALALAFAGAILGFLRFNTFPASVFMGDAGSQLLGFGVGVLSLRATQSGATAISAATPILLLALPILDTLSVMVQRISENRSPFSPDKNHIHHKLLALGFEHHEAVMAIYVIQANLFLVAYWLRYESDVAILAVVTGFFAASIALFQTAARIGWKFHVTSAERRNSLVPRLVTKLREPAYLPRWSYLAVTFGVGSYALLVVSETASFSGDILWLLAALLAITGILLCILRIKPLSLIEKGALYVTVAVLVYLDDSLGPSLQVFAKLTWVAVIVAAFGACLRLRLSPDRRFVMTPLDLIILFVALVVPSLSGFIFPAGSATAVAKLVILFYAIEVLVTRVERRAVWFRLATTGLLAGLVLRPLLST